MEVGIFTQVPFGGGGRYSEHFWSSIWGMKGYEGAVRPDRPFWRSGRAPGWRRLSQDCRNPRRHHGLRIDWPRPEFRHIFYGIWVAAAVSENMGKFGPVAGLSTRAKNMGKISTFDAPSSPASLETQAMRSALSGPALGGAGMVGDAISDACGSTLHRLVIVLLCRPRASSRHTAAPTTDNPPRCLRWQKSLILALRARPRCPAAANRAHNLCLVMPNQTFCSRARAQTTYIMGETNDDEYYNVLQQEQLCE